jgi:hypothetical protein
MCIFMSFGLYWILGLSHLTVWAIPDVLPWANSLFELYQMSYPEPPHCFSCARCPTKSHLLVWAIPDIPSWATSLFELYQMPYHEPPHCLSYTRCPTMSHLAVWAIPNVIPWATLLFQLYQMSYHEPLHCLRCTRYPTNHHICHSQGEFLGTSVGWCILQSGGQIGLGHLWLAGVLSQMLSGICITLY